VTNTSFEVGGNIDGNKPRELRVYMSYRRFRSRQILRRVAGGLITVGPAVRLSSELAGLAADCSIKRRKMTC